MSEIIEIDRHPENDDSIVLYNVFEIAVGALAVVALLALMFLVFIDVISRYLFSSPISGTYQLGSTFMVILLFAGLPIVSSQETHLTVGFTDNMFHGRLRHIQQSAINFLSGFVMGIVCWRLWVQGGYFTVYPEVLEILDIRLSIFCYFMIAFRYIKQFYSNKKE